MKGDFAPSCRKLVRVAMLGEAVLHAWEHRPETPTNAHPGGLACTLVL